jgi:cytochrome c peroxidase
MRSRTFAWSSGAVVIATAAAFGVRPPAADAGTSYKERKQEALVELGRRLFMDPSVSRLGRNSCASCHDPERGFSDARATSPDDDGATRRHSQTVLDLTGQGFHWDGVFKSVRQLLVARVAPPEKATEQALKLATERTAAARAAGEDVAVDGAVDESETSDHGRRRADASYGANTPTETPLTPVAERLAEDGRYAEAFRAAFGVADPTTDRVLDAMDAYCASLRSTTNAYDRFLAGDEEALAPAARRGMFLFDGKAACSTCHAMAPVAGRALFTDGRFHDTGVAYHANALCRNGLEGSPSDPGRGAVTLFKADLARFKTPTLRDVATRGPFMHDASFTTLADVVRYYDEGGTRHVGIDPAIRPLGLSKDEIADVVAFLESLTGETRGGLGFPLPHATPLRVKVEDLAGKPVPCLALTVERFGDRLVGADVDEPPTLVATGSDGVVVFERPLWTHVLLTARGHEVGLSRPIPDTCESQTLIATPRDTISLRVRRTPSGPALADEIVVAPGAQSMPGCGGEPVLTLKKIRSLGPREALYACPGIAPVGRAVGPRLTRCTLLVGETRVLCDIDLSGGASETILLDAPRRR